MQTQNELTSMIQLTSIWDSERFCRLRRQWAEVEVGASAIPHEQSLISLEPLLEFLEEFAGLHGRKVLGDKLVWDSTIGWHATRYYLYNSDNGNLARLREKWADETLYQNLLSLWHGYVKVEKKERGISENELQEQIRSSKTSFIEAERQASL